MLSKRVSHRRGNCVLESLEVRRHFAATVSLSGSTLSIIGDAGPQNVEIYESDYTMLHQTLVFVDANGNGNFTDPGDVNGAAYSNVTNLVAQLGQGGDKVKILLADPFMGATHNYDIRTGAGADTVSFTNILGNDIRDSNVSLNIATGGGADTVNLTLNRIATSTFQANLDLGDGNDTVNLYAGAKVSDSTVNITSVLGSGTNTMNQTLDYEGFGLLGASTVWRVTANGGTGSDTLNAIGQSGTPSTYIDGLLDIGYFGGGGNDRINLALGTLNLRGGTLRLRGNGNGGQDAIGLSGNFGAINGGGTIDIVLRGGAGNDTITSSANSDPANQYESPSGALFDGGADFDTAVVSGTLLATLTNTEA